MSENALWPKLLLILAVVVGAVAVSYPPKDKVNLGLDLKGGAHILIGVDTDSALEFELEQTQNRIGNALRDESITFGSVLPTDKATLEIRDVDPAREEDADRIIRNWTGNYEVQNVSAGNYRLSLSPTAQSSIIEEAVETSLITLRKRVDGLGVSEPLVQKQGINGDRILVQLPGVQDLTRIKNILKEVALLEWRAVSYPAGVGDPRTFQPATSQEMATAMFGGTLPDDTELVPESRDGLTLWWPLKRVAVVSGSDLKRAQPSADQFGSPAVQFELSGEAGRRFERATRENVNKHMAIVLTNASQAEAVSVPVIRGPIRDIGVIEGGFTADRAQTLSLQLRSGALPATLSIMEERTVGPTLGRDSIQKGLYSGIAGFVGVMLFMVIYYRLSGVNAIVALAMNILLVFAGLAILPLLFQAQGQATLTLPGIAGMILTVGMAVDNNVLIFERIREELRNGKTVRSAVDQGFSRAFTTILDCNVTTLVAAFFLWAAGDGPVSGFAVTLTIGLLASMFTAVFVSRQLFEIVLSRSPKAQSLSI